MAGASDINALNERFTNGGKHVLQVTSDGVAVSKTNGAPVVDANIIPVAVKQAVNVSYTVAQNLPDVTNQIAAGATMALIQVLLWPIRWADDGTDPSTSFGMQLPENDQFYYVGDLSNFKIISQAAGELAEVNVAYYKQA